MRLTKGDSAVHTAARALEGRTSGCVCQCRRTPSNVARRAARRVTGRGSGGYVNVNGKILNVNEVFVSPLYCLLMFNVKH